ncbi:Alpha/beta hydrolase fold-1 [Diaporthe sp. PMI_573]|nr:Alpha/beta hydrolase fold-1 [Diaporthaceae sp. PMI_573]
MAKQTIIIVPGAWQKPSAFANIVKLLQDAGYPTVHVPLPTVGGTELPLAGLSDDVNAVRKVLIPIVEDGKEVVVIGHSAGGISMSGAVEGYDTASRKAAGKAGGVVRCIFMTAFVLPKGQSLLGMLGGQPLPWMVVEGDRVTGNPEMIPQVGLNDLSPEEQTKWAAEMTHTSAALFAAPALYEPWANGIPCSYIFHTEDNALPLAYQQGMAQLLGPDAKTATLKAGHSSFLSIPDQLVKVIESMT